MISIVGGANQVPLVRYYPPPMSVLRLEPPTGSKVGGMAGGGLRLLHFTATVLTTLKDPAMKGDRMRCRFGSSSFEVTPTAFTSATGIVQCLPPAHDAGTVSVGFTLDGNVWLKSLAQ